MLPPLLSLLSLPLLLSMSSWCHNTSQSVVIVVLVQARGGLQRKWGWRSHHESLPCKGVLPEDAESDAVCGRGMQSGHAGNHHAGASLLVVSAFGLLLLLLTRGTAWCEFGIIFCLRSHSSVALLGGQV